MKVASSFILPPLGIAVLLIVVTLRGGMDALPMPMQIVFWGLVGYWGCLVIGIVLPKSSRSTRSIVVPQEPETVWRVITDFAASPAWEPGLKSVERLPSRGGVETWQQTVRNNRSIFEILECDPPNRLVKHFGEVITPYSNFQKTMAHEAVLSTHEIQPMETGSRIHLTWVCRLRGFDPLGNFISHTLGHLISWENQREYLKALTVRLSDTAP